MNRLEFFKRALAGVVAILIPGRRVPAEPRGRWVRYMVYMPRDGEPTYWIDGEPAKAFPLPPGKSFRRLEPGHWQLVQWFQR